MKAASWGTTGTITRKADRQRRDDLRRQRDAEREGGLPRHSLGTQGDEHEEIADDVPPGYARPERWR